MNTKDMKSGTTDKLEGTAKQVSGAVKETAGKIFKDPKLAARGSSEKQEGQIQHKVGEVKKVLDL
jgi:uncharacterized protein YjbJ (UPF0337 family)